MYTLRIFKDKGEIDRTQIYLGDSYVVKGVCEEDEKLDIKLRVMGEGMNDGICIHNDDFAFIMTDSGKTFETLNRPN